ncbi:hypothetical protein EDD85DRAFT_957302 [Armillaria nabsnona]|nr:hypothetical protein EDD85DRAFT_957302 [Armillaria nabsnona]
MPVTSDVVFRGICVVVFDGHVGTSYTQFMKRFGIKLRRTRRESGARKFTQDATGFYATSSEDPIFGT